MTRVTVFFFFLIFIYLAAPCLSCGMWDPASWPGIKPRPPAFRVQSLSHWTIKEVPASAAAKSPQSCPTLCNPIDGSPPGSPVSVILQARILEWVVISFSNAWMWKVKVKLLSRVRLLATSWTAAYQAPPSMGFSRQEYWSRVPFPSPRKSLGWLFKKKSIGEDAVILEPLCTVVEV